MPLESKIISILQPILKLDQMTIIDTETGATGAIDVSENKRRKTGDLFPFIMINKYTLVADELLSFSISEADFLPFLEFSMAMNNGIFQSNHFPKDGDVVSVYIRSKRKLIKPIRMDFDIMYIDANPSRDSSGETNIFSFLCVLRIPGMFAENCKAFRNKTSFDTIMSVSKELGLGFATNMTRTLDEMTWICPNLTYREFIAETTRHAYASDESFFTTFVDKYYHVNFVDLKQQLDDGDQNTEKSIEVETNRLDHMVSDEEIKPDDTNFKILLGNHPNLKKTSMFIEGYTLKSSSGQIILENGYRRSAQFYDVHLSGPFKDRYQSHVVEPPVSGTKNVSNKGRAGETYSDNISTNKWVGTQSSNPKGNTHKNYKYSLVSNWQNSKELDKIHLEVVLSQCNFNLRRGMRLPVLIFNFGNTHRLEQTKEKGEETEFKFTIDRFTSGFYVLLSMKTVFSMEDGVFRQVVKLGRRDWPKPVNYDKTTDRSEK